MEIRISKASEVDLQAMSQRYGHPATELDSRYPLNDLINKLSTLREPEILHQQLSSDQTTHESLGKEILHEAGLHSGHVQLKSFLTWVHTQSLALHVIQKLTREFPGGVEILEHYNDYFRLKLDKAEGSSIGRLFGLIEMCKESLINEYSVS